MTQSTPELLPTEREEAIFAQLCAKYVQRADARQQSMGLQYTQAETHDLARFIARIEHTTPDRNAVLSVLETARDYFTDAANGTLTYEGSGEGFKAMAKEDLARLEAALTTTSEPTDPAGVSEMADELERAAQGSTPGPWEYEPDYEGSGMGWIGRQVQYHPPRADTVFSSMFEVEGDSAEQAINAELIVKLVNSLPAILAALRTPSPVLEVVTDEQVQRAIFVFNGGVVRVPNSANVRGYTDVYNPKDAMRAALQTINERGES